MAELGLGMIVGAATVLLLVGLPLLLAGAGSNLRRRWLRATAPGGRPVDRLDALEREVAKQARYFQAEMENLREKLRAHEAQHGKLRTEARSMEEALRELERGPSEALERIFKLEASNTEILGALQQLNEYLNQVMPLLLTKAEAQAMLRQVAPLGSPAAAVPAGLRRLTVEEVAALGLLGPRPAAAGEAGEGA